MKNLVLTVLTNRTDMVENELLTTMKALLKQQNEELEIDGYDVNGSIIESLINDTIFDQLIDYSRLADKEERKRVCDALTKIKQEKLLLDGSSVAENTHLGSAIIGLIEGAIKEKVDEIAPPKVNKDKDRYTFSTVVDHAMDISIESDNLKEAVALFNSNMGALGIRRDFVIYKNGLQLQDKEGNPLGLANIPVDKLGEY